MTYQVLARKWRPHRFEEMIGQHHVLQALGNALDSDRLHHAYLFTGTRGVGKTTIARIFAKSLNCEKGVSASPCGECSACVEIDEGRFVDLIEVDAASRTGVDDTRDLLDNVQYAAVHGRYKVYLIDEVHMFSKSSFNALLKTLEEPPPHVKFLLATTDPKKIPATILSRCLQFNLKRLMPEQIEQQLTYILEKENIPADTRSLEMIAFAADGSVRDSLSLLDQAIAYCNGQLKADDVARMLGTIDKDQVLKLLELIAEKDPAAILQKVTEMDELGPDYHIILTELLVQLQAVAIQQLVPEVRKEHRDYKRIAGIAALLTPEEAQLYYQIALVGQRDMAFHPDPRGGFEMILLRMLVFEQQTLEKVTSEKKKPTAELIAPEPAASEETPIVQTDPEPSGATDQPMAGETVDSENWHQIVGSLGISGLAQQLALECAFEKYEQDEFQLFIKPGTFCTERTKSQLQQALRENFGQDLRLLLTEKDLIDQETPRAKSTREEQERLDEAKRVIESDPNIQTICKTFDAKIIEDSIRPTNKTK